MGKLAIRVLILSIGLLSGAMRADNIDCCNLNRRDAIACCQNQCSTYNASLPSWSCCDSDICY